MAFFSELELILKFIWNTHTNPTAKEIMRKNKVGSIMLPDIKIYYEVTVIKII